MKIRRKFRKQLLWEQDWIIFVDVPGLPVLHFLEGERIVIIVNRDPEKSTIFSEKSIKKNTQLLLHCLQRTIYFVFLDKKPQCSDNKKKIISVYNVYTVYVYSLG